MTKQIAVKTREKWVDDVKVIACIDEFVVISNHKFATHFEEWKNNKEKTRSYEITVIDDGTSTNESRLTMRLHCLALYLLVLH